MYSIVCSQLYTSYATACLHLQLPQPRLLEMALHALVPFLSWMPVSHVFGGTPGSDLLDLLVEALSVPALRMPAAECLRVMAARKVSDVGYGGRQG